MRAAQYLAITRLLIELHVAMNQEICRSPSHISCTPYGTATNKQHSAASATTQASANETACQMRHLDKLLA